MGDISTETVATAMPYLEIAAWVAGLPVTWAMGVHNGNRSGLNPTDTAAKPSCAHHSLLSFLAISRWFWMTGKVLVAKSFNSLFFNSLLARVNSATACVWSFTMCFM